MQPKLSADQESIATERLLGCSVTPLPGAGPPRRGAQDRIQALLEWLVGVARADRGVVLLCGEDDRLVTRATTGLGPNDLKSVPTGLDGLRFGLIVHGAEIDDHVQRAGLDCCEHGLALAEARMAICLPLESSGTLFGAAQVGFRELRSLGAAEIHRLGMIVDHIASACEAERHAHESARRLAEVERMSGVLDEIDRMKGEFLSMISHELRTPLTAIIGYTDLLLRQIHGTLNDRQAHHQQAVKKAAHRLLELINELLDLNRLEGGHVVLNLDDVPLIEAINRAVSRSARDAEHRGVELRLDLPLSAVSVRADAERLQQILGNLLDNAIKFTPRDGTVAVRVDQGDDLATVSVVDTGAGVPPDQIERIWDRFHQADSSTRRKHGGSGLGLAIVRHLVELHGGSVSVSSAGPRLGSTFSFTIPVVRGDAAVTDAPPVEPVTASPAAEASRTVLIVDDEADNRDVISSIVQDVLGHAVLAAASGHEALEQVKRGPDLILLDLRMPGLNGFEVARALKRDPSTAQIPIIAITALDDEDDRRAAIDAGCIGCVTKPFTEEALADAVTSVLASARARTSP